MLTAAQIAHGGACRSDLSSVCLKSALQIPASGTVKCVLVSSKAGRVSRRMIASSPSGGVGAVSASDRREVGDPLRLVLLGGIRQKSDDVGTQPVRFRKSQLLVDDARYDSARLVERGQVSVGQQLARNFFLTRHAAVTHDGVYENANKLTAL
jgi:hypothetical protein